jgi:hypothetical protein
MSLDLVITCNFGVSASPAPLQPQLHTNLQPAPAPLQARDAEPAVVPTTDADLFFHPVLQTKLVLRTVYHIALRAVLSLPICRSLEIIDQTNHPEKKERKQQAG